MKVVHICTSDSKGGASIACKRISDALVRNGLKSSLLVQKKTSNETSTYDFTEGILNKLSFAFRFIFDESYIRLFTKQSRGRFTNPLFGIDISNHPVLKEAEIINLHWVNGGYLSLKSLNELKKLGKHVVWTLHDMWAFTGGCHYSLDCKKFNNECNNCPSINLHGKRDISNKIFLTKKEIFKDFNLSIVTCSKWLAHEARESSLLGDKLILNIPNPIDTEIFKPHSKSESRRKLDLPEDKFTILFGSMSVKDERKGFNYLIESLNLLLQKSSEIKDKIELVIFGAAEANLLQNITFKVHQFGRIKDESQLISLYNSADIFVLPSIQDNLPNTVLEAIACGTPVLTFNIGGFPDMIEHLKNGYLAEPESAESLAIGLNWFIENPQLHDKMKEYSREKALAFFTLDLIGKKYIKLYESLI